MSITVPLEGFGGGGAALNFAVKAYPTEEALLAAAPKENTIGLITAETVNGWIFSVAEPADPAEGMVWISTGTSSFVEFNALKKNGLQVYPISAKQYISGAWVDVTAMSYQGGEWVDWCIWIVKNGIRTGFNTAVRSGHTAKITPGDGYFKVGPHSSSASYTAPLCTDEKHDLTNRNIIEFDVDFISGGTTGFSKINGCAVYLLPSTGYSSMDAINNAAVVSAFTKTKGRQLLTLNVSNITGAYYIAISVLTDNSDIGYMNVYNLVVK